MSSIKHLATGENPFNEQAMDLYSIKKGPCDSFPWLVQSSPSTLSHCTHKASCKVTQKFSKTHWTLKTSGSKLSLFPVSTNGSAEWNEEIQASFQPEWWQKVIHAYWPGERAVIYFFRFKRNPNPQNSLHRQVSSTKQLLWQGIGRTTTFVLVVLMQPHKNESQLSWLRTGRKRTWRELD